MPKKETSNKLSKLASDVLSGRKSRLTAQEKKSLAASVLSQDETKGKRRT